MRPLLLFALLREEVLLAVVREEEVEAPVEAFGLEEAAGFDVPWLTPVAVYLYSHSFPGNLIQMVVADEFLGSATLQAPLSRIQNFS